VVVMTEVELASLREEEGRRIRRREGRPWERIFPGFYQPVNLLARLEPGEIHRPTRLCWGYRAALADADAAYATGSVPVHLLSVCEGFSEDTLNRNRRADLKKCRDRVEFARMRDSAVLAEQGYGVFQSAMRRVAYWHPLSEPEYRQQMRRSAADDRWFIIAGLVEGKLGGYMKTLAVDGVLYMYDIIVASESLESGISTGLYIEAVGACLRSGKIDSVCSGLHTPENNGLCQFKRGVGFQVVHVPAVSVIPRPIGAYIKAKRPAVYYRLTGTKPASPA
jgi:hypothetical protein